MKQKSFLPQNSLSPPEKFAKCTKVRLFADQLASRLTHLESRIRRFNDFKGDQTLKLLWNFEYLMHEFLESFEGSVEPSALMPILQEIETSLLLLEAEMENKDLVHGSPSEISNRRYINTAVEDILMRQNQILEDSLPRLPKFKELPQDDRNMERSPMPTPLYQSQESTSSLAHLRAEIDSLISKLGAIKSTQGGSPQMGPVVPLHKQRRESTPKDSEDSAILVELTKSLAQVRAEMRDLAAQMTSPQAQLEGIKDEMTRLTHQVEAVRFSLRNVADPSLQLDVLQTEISGLTRLLSQVTSREDMLIIQKTLRDLTRQLDQNDGGTSLDRLISPLEHVAQELRSTLVEALEHAKTDVYEQEISKLNEKVDGLCDLARRAGSWEIQKGIQDILLALSTRTEPPAKLLSVLEERLGDLGEKLEYIAQQSQTNIQRTEQLVRNIDTQISDHLVSKQDMLALEKILQGMEAHLERASHLSPQDLATIETTIQGLCTRLQKEGGWNAEFQAVQDLVRDLSQKIDRGLIPKEQIGKLEELLKEILDRAEYFFQAASVKSEEYTGKLEELRKEVLDRAEYFFQASSGKSEEYTRHIEELIHLFSRKFDRLEQRSNAPFERLETQMQDLEKVVQNIKSSTSHTPFLRDMVTRISDQLEVLTGLTQKMKEEGVSSTLLSKECENLGSRQTKAELRLQETLNNIQDMLAKALEHFGGKEPLFIQKGQEGVSTLSTAPLQKEGANATHERVYLEFLQRLKKEKVESPAITSFDDSFLIEPRDPSAGDAENSSAQKSRFIAAARRASQTDTAPIKDQKSIEVKVDRGDVMSPSSKRRKVPIAGPFSRPMLHKTFFSRQREGVKNFSQKNKRSLLVGFAALTIAIFSFQLVRLTGSSPHAFWSQEIALQENDHVPSNPEAVVEMPSSDKEGRGPGQLSPLSSIHAFDQTPVASIAPSTSSKGTPSKESSREELLRAAQGGDKVAQYMLALKYAEGNASSEDLAKSAQWLEKSALQNFALAQYNIAVLYEKGQGVPKNRDLALKWYKRSAENGNVVAMHNFAVLMAEEGLDTKPDYALAAAWFRKAADFGEKDSQYNLAVLYARGAGVEQNLVQAYTWFGIAAKKGDTGASRERDKIGLYLDSKQLAGAKAAIDTFQQKVPNRIANELAVSEIFSAKSKLDSAL